MTIKTMRTAAVRLILVALVAVISGCAVYGLPQRQAYVAAHPELTSNQRHNITMGYVTIGMTREHLIASWGRPHDINRTVTAYGVSEQFVYGTISQYSSQSYVYLEDGIVTSWQK